MTTYNLKHADGTIVETFNHSNSAKEFQSKYHEDFGEELIIEKVEVEVKKIK